MNIQDLPRSLLPNLTMSQPHSLYLRLSPYNYKWLGIFPSKNAATLYALRNGIAKQNYMVRRVTQLKLKPRRDPSGAP